MILDCELCRRPDCEHVLRAQLLANEMDRAEVEAIAKRLARAMDSVVGDYWALGGKHQSEPMVLLAEAKRRGWLT